MAIRIGITIAVLAASVWFVVLPQLSSANDALKSLEQPPILVLAAATLLEAASIAAYSGLTVRILGRQRLSYFTALRIDATDLGVNHVLPGGGATASAIRFRLLVRAGIPAGEALSGATIEIILSNVALGLIFGVGLTTSLTAIRSAGYYLVALVAVVALLVAAGLAAWLLDRRVEWCVRVVRRVGQRFRRIGADRAEKLVRTIARGVRQLVHRPRRLWLTSTLALGNWILDAAALYLMFIAFGEPPPIATLVAVYSLGTILAMLPFTPGGLGLVEGVMVPAFAALGVPSGEALLAVIGWRVLEYWIPIPLSAIAYGSLRYSQRAGRAHSTSRPAPPKSVGLRDGEAR